MHGEAVTAVLLAHALDALGEVVAVAAPVRDVADQIGHARGVAEAHAAVEHLALLQLHGEADDDAQLMLSMP